MLKPGSSDSVSGFVGGVAQNILANICAALIGGACVRLGLATTDKLEDWSNWPIWLVMGGALIFMATALNSISLLVWQWRRRAAVRPPPGDRVSVLIARLSGDGARSIRETIREALHRELGHAVHVVFWPDALELGNRHDAEPEAAMTAQRWLKRKSCDILIWGRVKSDAVIVMRFTVAEGASSDARDYRLTDDTLGLPTIALADLGTAIAARVANLGAQAVSDRGHDPFPLMRSIATRLKPLVEQPGQSFSSDTRGMIAREYANFRTTLGDMAGDADDLLEAIAVYHLVLCELTRDRVPLEWAATQYKLGIALQKLGARESGTARLEEAVAACRAALEELARDRVPLDWGISQHSLGNALATFGAREIGTARLQEAIAAFRAALEELVRDRVPLDWARTQTSLGSALVMLAGRETGTARLEEAVMAYRAALEIRTRERVPLDWAMTHNNIGIVLFALGEREGRTTRVEEAIAAFLEALEVRTRDRVPLDWALTQTSLGIALQRLGEEEKSISRLEQAVAAQRSALEENTRGRVPLYWAATKVNLGNALLALGEQESGTAGFEEAIAAYRAALQELTRDRVPLDWAKAQNNLGGALQALAMRESGTVSLEAAIAAYRAALEEWTRDRLPFNWAQTQMNLGNALAMLGEREGSKQLLVAALAAFDDALSVFVSAKVDRLTQICRTNRVILTTLIAECERTERYSLGVRVGTKPGFTTAIPSNFKKALVGSVATASPVTWISPLANTLADNATNAYRTL